MLPDFKKILSIDSSRVTANLVVDAVGGNESYFKILMDAFYNEKSPINWRALRVIDICTDNNSDLFVPYVNKTAGIYPDYKEGAIKRILPKLFSKHVDKINQENCGILINTCFEYLLSGSEAVAVKVNCMQLLYELSKRVPEIRGELQAAIEFHYDEGTTGYKSRAKKILKELNFIDNF